MSDSNHLLPPEFWFWIGGISLFTFVCSLVVLPLIIVRMSEDYFLHDRDEKTSLAHQRPALRITGLIFKNLLGGILLLAGLIMIVTPGQGLLTILMGLVLMNFPGKRKMELKLLSQPAVHQSLNWIRSKAGRPPLILPGNP